MFTSKKKFVYFYTNREIRYMITQNISFYGLRPDIYKVNTHLMCGPAPKYADLKELRKEGVTQIVDLRRYLTLPCQISEKIKCLLLGIKYHWYPLHLKKAMPNKNFLHEVSNLVKINPNNTYVHCHSGKHRTGFVTAAVEIINEGKPIDKAINEMLERGYWKVKPRGSGELKAQKKIVMAKRLDDFKKIFSDPNANLNQ